MAVVKGIMLVITPVLLTDEHFHTIRPSTISAVVMVGLTTKASCQVVYPDNAKITFHVKRLLIHLVAALMASAVAESIAGTNT